MQILQLLYSRLKAKKYYGCGLIVQGPHGQKDFRNGKQRKHEMYFDQLLGVENYVHECIGVEHS